MKPEIAFNFTFHTQVSKSAQKEYFFLVLVYFLYSTTLHFRGGCEAEGSDRSTCISAQTLALPGFWKEVSSSDSS